LTVIKLNVVEHGAIKLHNVGPAVIVVIEKLHRHPTEMYRLVANAGSIRIIGEGAVAVVVIKTVQLKIKMGNVDVLPAVAADIGAMETSAPLGTRFSPVSGPGL